MNLCLLLADIFSMRNSSHTSSSSEILLQVRTDGVPRLFHSVLKFPLSPSSDLKRTENHYDQYEEYVQLVQSTTSLGWKHTDLNKSYHLHLSVVLTLEFQFSP